MPAIAIDLAFLQGHNAMSEKMSATKQAAEGLAGLCLALHQLAAFNTVHEGGQSSAEGVMAGSSNVRNLNADAIVAAKRLLDWGIRHGIG